LRPFLALAVSCLVLGSWNAASPQNSTDLCVRHIHPPTYPPLARGAQLQGTINVQVDVDVDGSVRSAKASGGQNLLNEAVEKNIREWSFCPSLQTHQLMIQYVYRLVEKSASAPDSDVFLDLPGKVTIVSQRVQGGY
jgi:TonB family protein